MKEFEDLKKDRVVSVVDQQQEKKIVMFKSLDMKPGMQVWKLDLHVGKIELAEYEKDDAIFTEENGKSLIPVSRKLIVKEQTYYCVAINKKNAKRKFAKMLDV